MRFSKMLSAIDTHTECDPTRLIVSGLPKIPGKTAMEKKNYFASNCDVIRKLLMQEPRGHKDMFGAAFIQSEVEGADLGLFFMDCDGYLNLCGHGVMAATTVAIETGMVQMNGPVQNVSVETPAGMVDVQANIKEGRVESTTITAVPSFVYGTGIEVDIPSVGKVPVDISYGGNFFAFIDSKHIGVEVERANVTELIRVGMVLKNVINEMIRPIHPELGEMKVDLVEIIGSPTILGADCCNILIYGEGQVGRDPCATGTCAKIALEVSKGKLKIGQDYICQGIMDTVYKGQAIKEIKVGNYSAVVPSITGRTFVTAFHQFVVDFEDPLPEGWLL